MDTIKRKAFGRSRERKYRRETFIPKLVKKETASEKGMMRPRLDETDPRPLWGGEENEPARTAFQRSRGGPTALQNSTGAKGQ